MGGGIRAGNASPSYQFGVGAFPGPMGGGVRAGNASPSYQFGAPGGGNFMGQPMGFSGQMPFAGQYGGGPGGTYAPSQQPGTSLGWGQPGQGGLGSSDGGGMNPLQQFNPQQRQQLQALQQAGFPAGGSFGVPPRNLGNLDELLGGGGGGQQIPQQQFGGGMPAMRGNY
jgi:hypothetical protein